MSVELISRLKSQVKWNWSNEARRDDFRNSQGYLPVIREIHAVGDSRPVIGHPAQGQGA